MNQTRIYVSCAQSREIQVFSLDTETGTLALFQQQAVPGSPQPIGLGAGQRVLYAGLRPEGLVAALSIDPQDGRLSLQGVGAIEGMPTYLATDRARQVLFSASYGGNCLCVCPLDAQGVPGPISQCEYDIPHAHAALTDKANRWVLVSALGEDAIRTYQLENGKLSLHHSVATRPGSGPRHLVLSRDERHIWCINELDGTVDLFAFDATTGNLTQQQSVSMLPPVFSGKPWAAELRVTANERFLYATDRSASNIAAFAIETDSGRLSLIGHVPTEEQPRGMAIDPSGQWLAVVGQQSNHLSLYAIEPGTGRLEIRQRIAAGLEPIMVEIVSLPV